MSVDLNAELAALRQLVLNSKDDLTRYRAAHSNDCFSTAGGCALRTRTIFVRRPTLPHDSDLQAPREAALGAKASHMQSDLRSTLS
jgi:hypothetical protein